MSGGGARTTTGPSLSSLTCSPSATGLASEVDGSASGAAAGAAAPVGAVCGELCVLESGVSAGIVEARRGEAGGGGARRPECT